MHAKEPEKAATSCQLGELSLAEELTHDDARAQEKLSVPASEPRETCVDEDSAECRLLE